MRGGTGALRTGPRGHSTAGRRHGATPMAHCSWQYAAAADPGFNQWHLVARGRRRLLYENNRYETDGGRELPAHWNHWLIRRRVSHFRLTLPVVATGAGSSAKILDSRRASSSCRSARPVEPRGRNPRLSGELRGWERSPIIRSACTTAQTPCKTLEWLYPTSAWWQRSIGNNMSMSRDRDMKLVDKTLIVERQPAHSLRIAGLSRT